jgi:voltage-gated potassium channel
MATHELKDIKRFYPRWKRIRAWLGLSGVSRKESAETRFIGTLFEWAMLLILIWLPFQWQLDRYHLLSPLEISLSNWAIWLAFVIEATVMLWLVERKWHYAITNWMNLVIIFIGMPLLWFHLPLFASVRGFRFILTLSILIPWIPIAFDVLAKNKLGATLVIFFIVTVLSGIAISFMDSGFHDPFQGIWFAWETVTSVGYGDVVPVTWVGKLLSILIMLMGACLFSLLTANFSAYLISRQKKEEAPADDKKELLAELKSMLTELNDRMKALEEK